MYLAPVAAAVRRGQQQNWPIQLVICSVLLSNTIVHQSPSTSRMAHQEYPRMRRARVDNRCHLRLVCAGSYISLYEGSTTNSLCMCAFSTIKGGLPTSRPCLIHYLSVPQCFFPHCKFFVALQKCLPIYSQASRQRGRWQLQAVLVIPLDRVVQEQSSHRAEVQSSWGDRTLPYQSERP